MSPLSSGLGSQVGIAKETVAYGTRAVPAKFLEYASETLSLDKSFILSQQLRANRMFQSSSRRTATTRQAAGQIAFEVPNQGFGTILDLLHGNVVAPVQQGVTAAYKQTHDIGTTEPRKSATVQIGRPDTSGVVRPFDYLGAMATSLGLSCEVNGFLQATLGLDARDEKTDQTLAAASYPTNLKSFNFTQGTVTVAGSAVAVISSFDLSITIPWKNDRFFFGSAGLKSQPLVNAFATAEATLNAEFDGLTNYNRFINGDIAEVILDFVGPVIEGANNEQVKITLPACGFNGSTPNVSGPDVLALALPVVALDNGTAAPVRIEYVSRDTTL